MPQRLITARPGEAYCQETFRQRQGGDYGADQAACSGEGSSLGLMAGQSITPAAALLAPAASLRDRHVCRGASWAAEGRSGALGIRMLGRWKGGLAAASVPCTHAVVPGVSASLV